MEISPNEVLNFIKSLEGLSIVGILLTILTISVFINYKIFTGKFSECEIYQKEILQALSEIKELIKMEIQNESQLKQISLENHKIILQNQKEILQALSEIKELIKYKIAKTS